MISSISAPIVFIDVETTGGSAREHRVTDIACIRYEGGVEVDRFTTLVNPQRWIPYNIQQLTGIMPEMVADAPPFEAIADRVLEILDGAFLCAHNAPFDYKFIARELQRTQRPFTASLLCTARLSRQLFPEHKRHNLSAIIERYGFSCSSRHRALGDAEVLVQFAAYIDATYPTAQIQHAINQATGNTTLPPQLSADTVARLPEQPGVYRFWSDAGELLYVGKSTNIRSRVRSHFSDAHHSKKERRLWHETYDITTTETASDLGASLLEVYEIKTRLPAFNRRSRSVSRLWLVLRTDSDFSYATFTITAAEHVSSDMLHEVYGVFRTKRQARAHLDELAKAHGLCPQLLGLERNNGSCFSRQLGFCRGACTGDVSPDYYNLWVEHAFASTRLRAWPFAGPITISCTNANSGITDRISVDQWVITAAASVELDEPIDLFPVTEFNFDYDFYRILTKHLLHAQTTTNLYIEHAVT